MNWDALLVIVAIWYGGYLLNKWMQTPAPKTPEQLQKEAIERIERNREIQERIEQSRADRKLEKKEWQAAYGKYLKSEKWQSLRDRVLRRADYRCEYCGAPATQVHHKKYPRSFSKMEFRGERLSKLKAICGKCHMKQHGID
jgi:5-methylcytosine-specific restriction endonuclease McrA